MTTATRSPSMVSGSKRQDLSGADRLSE